MSVRHASPLAIAFTLALVSGCAEAPSALAPYWVGSIGLPHRGVLTGGRELSRESDGLRWLRQDDRHYGLPRFASAIERAAAKVNSERHGAPLYAGDLSTRYGGRLLPHLSHRSGRDADLLLYVTTLSGTSVDSPGFVRFAADGLAYDAPRDRYLSFDVGREWLLIKALVEDPDARVQWIFVNHVLEAMLVEWALARGEPTDTVLRAELVMAEPAPPAEPHDDHVHVRTACAPEDITHGCEPNGPTREWLDATAPAPDESNAELVTELLRPIEAPTSSRLVTPKAD